MAVGYYLRRRTDLSFVILDSEDGPGGAWRRGWDSLYAFSPARYSSLPGWLMPGGPEKYPTRDEVEQYSQDDAKHADEPDQTDDVNYHRSQIPQIHFFLLLP